MSFNTDNGENILKKLGSDERMINYNNSFFKTGNLIINTFDFFFQAIWHIA